MKPIKQFTLLIALLAASLALPAFAQTPKSLCPLSSDPASKLLLATFVCPQSE